MKSGVAFNYTLTISQNPKNIKQITVLHIGHIHGRSSSLENQTLSSPCFASCILTQSPPYKAERIKIIHNRPQFGKKEKKYQKPHIPVHTSSNGLLALSSPSPSFLPYPPPNLPGDENQGVGHRTQERWRRSSAGAARGRTRLRGRRTKVGADRRVSHYRTKEGCHIPAAQDISLDLH